VLLGMPLFGTGAGIALTPVLLAAVSDADPRDSGLASGVANTAFIMGSALDLASLAGPGGLPGRSPQRPGSPQLAALVGEAGDDRAEQLPPRWR
jgi:hypothetical protein